jgi:anti-sigma regulatory factor (Ser/Thr protein kinase)
MPNTANVRLGLPNRPENVLVIRQALTGLADVLALDAIETNDLNTAVTEASNNVVMHAYEGEEGPLEMEAFVAGDALAVVVRDRGVGMRQHDGEGTGMGLAVIDALVTRVAYSEPSGGGTEVHMEFPLPREVALEAPPAGEAAENGAPLRTPGANGAVELQLAPPALARAILPRVLSALAARAHFSTDRIADVRTVADVLAANAGESLYGSHLAVGVTTSPRNLELRVGPLRTGHGESLIAAAADGLAPLIERLTDDRRVAPEGACETLELRLGDQR